MADNQMNTSRQGAAMNGTSLSVPVCVLHREEAQDDEGTQEAAPPRRVHPHGGGGFPAYWAFAAPGGEASQWAEADARHSASTCTPPKGRFSKNVYISIKKEQFNLAFFFFFG